jgi:c(7)-type cytochrome triheme protein
VPTLKPNSAPGINPRGKKHEKPGAPPPPGQKMRFGSPLGYILLLVLAVPSPGQPGQRFRLRPNAPPVLYGDVLIRRATATGTARAVTFSHWSHRLRYTCRVCHLELDFAMVRNTTEITEAANRAGEYCGACHDGRTAFACSSEAGCAGCHTGSLERDASRFLGFLRSGGSKFPIPTLREAGVDMSSPSPVEATLALFNRRVDELEALLG